MQPLICTDCVYLNQRVILDAYPLTCPCGGTGYTLGLSPSAARHTGSTPVRGTITITSIVVPSRGSESSNRRVPYLRNEPPTPKVPRCQSEPVRLRVPRNESADQSVPIITNAYIEPELTGVPQSGIILART